ncbi:hypothetical protein CDL12_30340 [Handroanthus impetiginosus]|uniref:NB-ARC domain-containing protein n=1 Tax=Handroanthus impetiginosus TaxID=429701 RepID=A0A2G9FVV5_9LAMI|nr:hypothetical protein CDL12_30340 [Handroanthus impetiginosus]
MAEATVTIVINKAIAAKALLEGETHNVRENIGWIETQMKTLQSYLSEDILDTYLLEIDSHKAKGPFGFLKHLSCTPCYAVTERYLSPEMKRVKKRAAEIKQFKRDITAKSNVDGEIWNETNKFQKKLYGHEETVRKIEAEIFSEKKKCKVISIIGTGGVGKTTVARDIYLRVRSKFVCSAMLYVSEESNYGEILLDIGKQVGLRENRMKQNMEEHLYSFLCSKKFLIFLDDASDKWDILKDIVMSDSRNGSRIIVSCREPIFPKLVFHLDILNNSEGKELFHNLILTTLEDTHSVVLKHIGDKIVQKCGGLPLAIEVAAGLLRAKERSERSWTEILERMSEGDENKISCLEKIVHAYVHKLVARNLIQVSRRKSDGRVKGWRRRSSFKKLPRLKKLVIVGAEMQTLEGLSCTRPFPQELEDLKLLIYPINTGDDIPTLDLSRYENLQRLYLYFDSSVNITCSSEFPKNLDEDPLKKLQKLPSLKVLMLSDTLFDQVIVEEIGMPKLNKLIYRAHPHRTSKVPEKLENVMVETAEPKTKKGVCCFTLWVVIYFYFFGDKFVGCDL